MSLSLMLVGLALPDLATRLGQCTRIALRPLDEAVADVEAALRGGARLVQDRDKTQDHARRLESAVRATPFASSRVCSTPISGRRTTTRG